MSDLTKRLEEMEGIADAADWKGSSGWWTEGELEGVINPPDRAFIATFDPPTVKALLRIAKWCAKYRENLPGGIYAHLDALEALHTEGESD